MKIDFPGLMQLLAATFRARLTDQQLEAYTMALDDVPIEDLARAVREAQRSCRFMPTPAELRELLAGGSVDEQAMNGWLILNRTIRKVGPHTSVLAADHALAHAIEDVFGGWPEANATRRELEEPAWQAKRKEFVAAYQRRRRQPAQAQGRAYLSGIADRENRRTRGAWERGEAATTQWIAVLEADRIIETRAPYDASGFPQLPATFTPTPTRRALPPPQPEVPPVTREAFLAQLKATLGRRSFGGDAPRELQRAAAEWHATRDSLRAQREATPVAATIESGGDDAHAEKVQSQIAAWRASEEAPRARRGKLRVVVKDTTT